MRFWLDRIRTLVSMTSGSSYMVIMGEMVLAIFSHLFFICSFPYLQVMRKSTTSRRISKFGQIQSLTAELHVHVAALERLTKCP